MKKNVTIEDIANALNMSRNTVSKALNGKHVPPKTRNAVINAAIEMGYKGYKLAASSEGSLGQKRFLILSSRLLMNINYYIFVLRGIEEDLSNYDIELVQFSITNPASFSKLKHYLSDSKVDGIICIEFFEPDYIAQLLELGLAIVFLDFPLYNSPLKGKYDIILPESQDIVKNFCIQMIQQENCRTFGFVGDYLHCRSFYERFTGMREALFLSGLPVDLQYSILDDDSMPYDSEMLAKAIRTSAAVPDCFVAANDSIAINLLTALKSLKIRVPSDVRVIGFDNVAESKHTTPPLTSVNVNKNALGKKIISLLLDRVNNPSQANQIIHVASNIVIRDST
ncbi:MAG: LacI family DNA-binding transcriptional regulator [Lachnospiraceae bacterium]|nr:LacI family DNA-binding transcriptional regulator [Lachnospiraceae bacterium]